MSTNGSSDHLADVDEILSGLDDGTEEADQQADVTSSEQTGEAGDVTNVDNTETQGDEANLATEEEQSAKAPATEDEPHKGNVTNALRASRRAERRARQEADAAKAELAALKAKLPAATTNDDESDRAIDEIAEDFPAAAEAIRKERKARREAEARAAELEKSTNAPAADQDFAPESFQDDVQDAIDSVPDLLDWQTNAAKQHEFAMAKSVDAMLMQHPKWAAKPITERFAEAVRRVKEELGEPATSQETTKPAARKTVDLSAVKRFTPETLSDLGSAGAPIKNASRLAHYMAARSSDEILADLDSN